MLSKKLAFLFAATLLTLGLASGAASAQCPIAKWSAPVDGGPRINQLHIFCGEIDHSKKTDIYIPKGYHSKFYAPPTDVVTGTQEESVPVNGVYDGQVDFIHDTHKFSTFFPDACTQEQILASVRYAHAHPAHPQPVIPWGLVGPSAPPQGGEQYCLGTNHAPINIRYAMLGADINTAFPYQ